MFSQRVLRQVRCEKQEPVVMMTRGPTPGSYNEYSTSTRFPFSGKKTFFRMGSISGVGMVCMSLFMITANPPFPGVRSFLFPC